MKSTCHNSSIIHYHNGYYCPVCFKEQFVTKSKSRILYAILPIVLMLSVFSLKAPVLTDKVIASYNLYPEKTDIINDIIPSDSTVSAELAKNNCILVSVAVAQARIESGNYKSNIAVNNKNLFGIKVHKCKYVTGEAHGHATFATYKDNIACYCHIQQMYLKKVHKAYAEDPLYCEKINKMK